ncbi:MAG: BLUF domain-containing protein [Salinimicrobium sp.]
MQHVICYISTATNDLKPEEVQPNLEEWAKMNSSKEIKGILLFSDRHFFQVLEGEKGKVLELFFKIKKDSRHSDIIQVMGKDVDQGSLDHYIVENLQNRYFSKPELIKGYLESVKGMDPGIQRQIKTILESFIDTRVL